jgi:hypothetical protein
MLLVEFDLFGVSQRMSALLPINKNHAFGKCDEGFGGRENHKKFLKKKKKIENFCVEM